MSIHHMRAVSDVHRVHHVHILHGNQGNKSCRREVRLQRAKIHVCSGVPARNVCPLSFQMKEHFLPSCMPAVRSCVCLQVPNHMQSISVYVYHRQLYQKLGRSGVGGELKQPCSRSQNHTCNVACPRSVFGRSGWKCCNPPLVIATFTPFFANVLKAIQAHRLELPALTAFLFPWSLSLSLFLTLPVLPAAIGSSIGAAHRRCSIVLRAESRGTFRANARTEADLDSRRCAVIFARATAPEATRAASHTVNGGSGHRRAIALTPADARTLLDV